MIADALALLTRARAVEPRLVPGYEGPLPADAHLDALDSAIQRVDAYGYRRRGVAYERAVDALERCVASVRRDLQEIGELPW